MNEIILVIAVLVVVFLTIFMKKGIKNPKFSYIKIAAAILLLALVWFTEHEGRIIFPILLSIIAVTTIVRETINLKRLKTANQNN